MAFHRCTVLAADGTVVCDGVNVSLEQTEHEGARTWHGTITATRLTALVAGQPYVILLDNGCRGPFVVRRNTQAGGPDRAVAIHGTGPLV